MEKKIRIYHIYSENFKVDAFFTKSIRFTCTCLFCRIDLFHILIHQINLKSNKYRSSVQVYTICYIVCDQPFPEGNVRHIARWHVLLLNSEIRKFVKTILILTFFFLSLFYKRADFKEIFVQILT